MNKVILKSISTENFATFADRVTFTTSIDNSKKEFLENTVVLNDMYYNKVSFIYGANGSGKTFFCKIIREIQRLLTWSTLTTVTDTQFLSSPAFKGIGDSISNFAFDTSKKANPTYFGIEIIINKTVYSYEFTIYKNKILSESLTKKYRRTECILSRNSPSYKDIELKSEFKTFEVNRNVVKEEALCLPMMAFLNNDLAIVIVDALKSIDVVSMTAPRIAPTKSRDSFSPERIDKYKNILLKADPTIRKMTVDYKEEETERRKIVFDDFENREIIAKKMTIDIKSEHAIFDQGEETDIFAAIDFFRDESLGTIKLFTALPHLYDILETGGIMIIDEIENGLHVSLVQEIIQLFINKNSNPNGAQLICTSHQPLLINSNTRRDQVWIVSKDSYGKSILSRVSDLKIGNSKVNLTNKLLDGTFGYNNQIFFRNNI